MKANVLAVLCLVVGTFAQASLQEKLAAKSETINAAKQNVKAGKLVVANDHCKFCNKDCRKA